MAEVAWMPVGGIMSSVFLFHFGSPNQGWEYFRNRKR